MKTDLNKAQQLLEAAASQRHLPLESELERTWSAHIKNLETNLNGQFKTIIAMLGTAILAKATHLNIDVFSLKTGKDSSTNNKYSARNLCTQVLAAHASRLHIDLGVTGREPLNNQPFFGKESVTKALENCHSQAQASMELLVQLLHELNSINKHEDAFKVLRIFVKERELPPPNPPELSADEAQYTQSALYQRINFFLKESEKGKRAQALVAGLFDVCYSESHVQTSKIHDPDRRFPGDVVLSHSGGEPFAAIEVRDKDVSANDLYHFGHKCLRESIPQGRLVICAGLTNLSDSDIEAFRQYMMSNRTLFKVYRTVFELVDEVLLSSFMSVRDTTQKIYERVLHRATELEVSQAGLEAWSQPPTV